MGLFSSSSSDAVCTPEPSSYYHAGPIDGSWTFHKIILVAAGGLAGATALIGMGLSLLHLVHYTNPVEQRQLVRAIMAPTVFAVFSLLSIAFYKDSGYLNPVADFYECFAMVAFFYYIIAIVTPDESKRTEFFVQLENRTKEGEIVPGGSLRWFYRRWLFVFQILPGRFITTIATWIVVATICPTSKKLSNALTIINVINGVQTVLCVMAIIHTYRRLNEYLDGHRIVAKLVTLKGVIGIILIQRAVFSGLASHNVFKGNDTISFKDFTVGLPSFLTACEVFIVSLFFIYAFTWAPYKPGNSSAILSPPHSPIRGFIDVWNFFDIIKGLFYTLTLRSLVKQAEANGPFEQPPPYMAGQQNGNGDYGRRRERA